MRIITLIAAAGLGTASCAPSPLYLGSAARPTLGTVPRDERGEPVWSLLPPEPPAPGSAMAATPPRLARAAVPPRRRAADTRRPGPEIPRDAAGEPIWALIDPPPSAARPLMQLAGRGGKASTGN